MPAESQARPRQAMMIVAGIRSRRGPLIFSVLHPAFALTGVMHAIGGALLPSLSSTFGLTDAQSGSLFFSYYLGTSLGALFCVRRFVRLMTAGFLLAGAACAGVAYAAGGAAGATVRGSRDRSGIPDDRREHVCGEAIRRS